MNRRHPTRIVGIVVGSSGGGGGSDGRSRSCAVRRKQDCLRVVIVELSTNDRSSVAAGPTLTSADAGDGSGRCGGGGGRVVGQES